MASNALTAIILRGDPSSSDARRRHRLRETCDAARGRSRRRRLNV